MKWTAIVAATLVTAACTSTSAGRSLSSRADPNRTVAVRVANHNWQDVRVYLQPVAGSVPIRLGLVPSNTTRTLTIHQPLPSGTARLLIRPIGFRSDSLYTAQILVQPGDLVRLNVENLLSLTSWAVNRQP